MTKKRRRLNIVDLIVIVVIALAAAWLAIYFVRNLGNTGVGVNIRYVIEVEKVRSEMSGKVLEGDSVFDCSDGKNIGKVSAVALSPAYYTGADEAGNVVQTKMDDFSVMYITVDISAIKTDAGFMLNNRYISAGSSYSIRTPSFYCEGECVSVKTVE